MSRSVMSGVLIAGAVLVLLGIAGIALPVFTTHDTKDVARVGDLKVQATENTPHVVPPILAEGAVLVGVVLLGAGLIRRSA